MTVDLHNAFFKELIHHKILLKISNIASLETMYDTIAGYRIYTFKSKIIEPKVKRRIICMYQFSVDYLHYVL